MASKEVTNIVKQMFFEGLKSEELVKKAIENNLGGTCNYSSANEDIHKHVDLWWDSPKKGKLGIDVKGKNKDKRSNKSYSDNHWIEAVNVKGNKGWIYGESDYIAFITENEILFVPPKKLISLYEEKISNKELVYDTPKECYIPYQRKKWGRKDIAFKMPNSDLIDLSLFTIKLK